MGIFRLRNDRNFLLKPALLSTFLSKKDYLSLFWWTRVIRKQNCAKHQWCKNVKTCARFWLRRPSSYYKKPPKNDTQSESGNISRNWETKRLLKRIIWQKHTVMWSSAPGHLTTFRSDSIKPQDTRASHPGKINMSIKIYPHKLFQNFQKTSGENADEILRFEKTSYETWINI